MHSVQHSQLYKLWQLLDFVKWWPHIHTPRWWLSRCCLWARKLHVFVKSRRSIMQAKGAFSLNFLIFCPPMLFCLPALSLPRSSTTTQSHHSRELTSTWYVPNFCWHKSRIESHTHTRTHTHRHWKMSIRVTMTISFSSANNCSSHTQKHLWLCTLCESCPKCITFRTSDDS